MKTRTLIFLAIVWLLFGGYWTGIACFFAGEQSTAGFLQDCFIFLVLFLLIGFGPIALTIAIKKKKRP